MYREEFNRQRYKDYMFTYYDHYKMGFIWNEYSKRFVHEGFLYQEPNPDYDKWLPENCTPIYFKDWLKDKIPEDFPRPTIGPKGSIYMHPRPCICVETGKFYISTRSAQRDGYVHASGDQRPLFSNDCRFVWVDTFWDLLHENDEQKDDLELILNPPKQYRGLYKKTRHNPNSARNDCKAVLDIKTGIVYETIGDCIKTVKVVGLNYRTIHHKRFSIRFKILRKNKEDKCQNLNTL